eukprot:13945765-Alexandrium_andersonii.AAC.1
MCIRDSPSSGSQENAGRCVIMRARAALHNAGESDQDMHTQLASVVSALQQAEAIQPQNNINI